METAPDCSGVLLVRAWTRGDQVVARLRWTVAPDAAQRTEVLVGAEQIEAAISRWLADVASGTPTPSE